MEDFISYEDVMVKVRYHKSITENERNKFKQQLNIVLKGKKEEDAKRRSQTVRLQEPKEVRDRQG